MGFSGGGDPLNQTKVSKLTSLSHVTSVNEIVSDQLNNSSSTNRDGSTSSANTSLTSAIEAGTLGQQSTTSSSSTTNSPPMGGGGGGFTPSISAYGQTDTTTLNSSSITLKSGSTISGTADKSVALVGSTLATKNSLKVGSTFTVYGETITVAGIFDSGTTFSNNSIILSLPTLQRLSSQTGDITSATVTVDSITNVDTVTSKVKSTLGSTADVTSSKASAESAIAPLNSVKTVSTFSLIGAVVAGAVIILLTMIMIVRERRREIGVLKAIGASNLKIMFQFIAEAITLTLLGSVVGIVLGVATGSPLTNLLVSNSSSSTTTQTRGMGGPGAGGAINTLQSIHAAVGWSIVLYGLLTAIIIAVLGSSAASFFISKIKPAEVMRAE
jgi:putative ABC transport system permease protein